MTKKPHSATRSQRGPETTQPPPDHDPGPPLIDTIVTLNYDYEEEAGVPPKGACYQITGNAINFNYIDSDDNDNTLFFSTVDIGDQLTCNGVTWTISNIMLRGDSCTFIIVPQALAPPFGQNTPFTFTPAGPEPPDEASLIAAITSALDIYQTTHGFVGHDARQFLTNLIVAEWENPSAAQARKAQDN